MDTRKIFPYFIFLLIAASCQTGSFSFHNDIYTRSTDSQYQSQRAQKVETQSEQQNIYNDDALAEEEEYYYDEEGGTQASAQSFEDFDEYDYYYTSRLRRFHTNVSMGWGFYDPFFTNMFWYDPIPANFGISIYLGCNWWWPTPFYRPWFWDWGWYSSGFSWGWGWGWGFSRPWGWGGNYWNGFWHGYNAGFLAGYYHNGFDRNTSFFYGHRNSIGPSSGIKSNRNIFGYDNGRGGSRQTTRTSRETFNQRFESISRNESSLRADGNRGSSTRGITPARESTATTTSRGTTGRQTGTTTTRGHDGNYNRNTNPDTRHTETTRSTTITRNNDINNNRNTNPNTRQTETTRSTTSTRQQPITQPQRPTYDSGFRPDNSRSTPTYTPPSNPSRNTGGSGFSSPGGGGNRGGSGTMGGGSSKSGGGSSRSGGTRR